MPVAIGVRCGSFTSIAASQQEDGGRIANSHQLSCIAVPIQVLKARSALFVPLFFVNLYP